MPSAAYWKQGVLVLPPATSAFMYELDAIAACVVEGVSFSGGVGTVFGGGDRRHYLYRHQHGLTYIGVSPYWQYIAQGGIIIFAVALDFAGNTRVEVVFQTCCLAYQITRRSGNCAPGSPRATALTRAFFFAF